MNISNHETKIFQQPAQATGDVMGIAGTQGLDFAKETLSSIGSSIRQEVMTHTPENQTTPDATPPLPGLSTLEARVKDTPLEKNVIVTKFIVIKNHLTTAFKALESGIAKLEKNISTIVKDTQQKAKPAKTDLKTGLPESNSCNNAVLRVVNQLRHFFDSSSHSAKELEATISQLLIVDPSDEATSTLKQDIKSMSQQASRLLQKHSAIQLTAKNSPNLTVIFLTDSEGKLEILVKGSLVGKGKTGEVFQAKSSNSDQTMAIKFADTSETTNEEDLKNEKSILSLLHSDGAPHEGVQMPISEAKLVSENGTSVQITKQGFYAKRDYQEQIEIMRMSRLLGVSSDTLQSMSKSELHQAIQTKIDLVAANITSFDRPCEIEFFKFASDVAILAGVLLGHERGTELQHACNAFWSSGKTNPNFNKNQALKDLVFSTFVQSAEVCQEKDKVPTSEKLSMAGNLIAGMTYIHSQGVIHGDLKPRNIFWDNNGAVIADFGGSQTRERLNKDIQTTPGYDAGSYQNALEYYNKQGDLENKFLAGRALDMRAMAMTFYEVFTGGSFPNETREKALFYGLNDGPDNFYQKMEKELIDAGVPQNAATIIATMAKPLPFDKNNPPPEGFRLPVTEQQIGELRDTLKTAGQSS